MKRTLITLSLLLTMTACADYDGHHEGRIAYNGYYDDSYGAIYDGYWGDGDTFYYRSSSHGDYIRDDGHHFRHDASNAPAERFHSFQGKGPRGESHHN